MKIRQTLLLVVISLSFLSAQELTSKGVKAGLLMANVSGNDIEDNSMKIGLGIGGFATLKFTDVISLQVEGMYSQKGYKTEIEFFGVTLSGVIATDYLDINPLALYTVNDKVYLLAGPSLGLFLNGEVSFEVEGESDSEKIKSDDMNGIDYGIIFACGYKLGSVNLEVRYGMGLKKAYDENLDVKNTSIQIVAAYGI